jgi:hypothetical protein
MAYAGVAGRVDQIEHLRHVAAGRAEECYSD